MILTAQGWREHSRQLADAPLPLRRRKRFSLSGTIGFERHIASDQARIADRVTALMPPDQFRALYLCAAYGRGEGVRLRAANGKEIAERYDYGVVLGRSDAPLRAAVAASLGELADALARELGVAVRFRVFRAERLNAPRLSFAQADLRWSGRLLRGTAEAVEYMSERPFEHLAPGEWLWHLLEEGLGLINNQERLRRSAQLAEYERPAFFRNLIRAVLACGDVRLALAGRYHPSHPEKLTRLQALDLRHHRKFMAFYQIAHRAHPDLDDGAFGDGHPLDWQARASWLWLDALRRFEHWRRKRPITSWEAYCRPYPSKGQGWRSSPLASLTMNLATCGAHGIGRQPLWALRPPRERLLGAMPLLLGGPQTAPEPAVLAALCLPAGSHWPGTVERFLRQCERHRD